MELKFKGNEILDNKILQDLLINTVEKVTFVKWIDESYADGLEKNIDIEIVNNNISVTDGHWRKEITEDIIIGIKIRDIEINKVYNSYEIAALFRKDEKSIRYQISKGALVKSKDYRKAGRITFISLNSVEKIYGELFKIRLVDFEGLKWKYLNDEEKEYLLSRSNPYFNSNKKYGECIVDFSEYNLSITGYLKDNNGEDILIIDDESVLYNSENRNK